MAEVGLSPNTQTQLRLWVHMTCI